MKRLSFFSLLLFLLLPAMGWGATYTVCSSGCDYNTIQGVFDGRDLAGGDIVEIRADAVGGSKTFTENVTIGANDGGDVGNPVIVRGRSGDVITVTSSSGNYTWVHVDPSNVTYRNLNFTSGVVASFRLGGGISNVTLEDCTTTDTNAGGIGFYVSTAVTNFALTRHSSSGNAGRGIRIDAASTGTVTDSTFNLNGSNGAYNILSGITWTRCDFSYNKGHGFWHNAGSSSGTIQNSTAHDNCSDYPTCGANNYRHGFVLQGYSAAAASGWVFRYNYSYNVDVGLDLQADVADVSNNQIYYNLLIGKARGESGNNGYGLLMAASNVLYANSGNSIYNNMIGTELADVAPIFFGQYTAITNVVKNNIFVHFAGGDVLTLSDLGATPYPTSDYNLWYSTKASPFNDKGTARTFTEWKTASLQDAHSKNSDPLFRSTSDYRLRAGSPACWSGTDVWTGTANVYDMASRQITDATGAVIGTARRAVSIGAYQCTDEATGFGWGMIYRF